MLTQRDVGPEEDEDEDIGKEERKTESFLHASRFLAETEFESHC